MSATTEQTPTVALPAATVGYGPPDWEAILGPAGLPFPQPRVTETEAGYAAAVFDMKGSVHAYESRGHLTMFIRVSTKETAVIERVARMAGTHAKDIGRGVMQLNLSGRLGERFGYVILPHLSSRRGELQAWMELRREVRYRGSEKLLPGDVARRQALIDQMKAARQDRKS